MNGTLSKKCNRCKQYKPEGEVKERKFRTSFNEILCEDCVSEMLDRGTIFRTDKSGMYAYDFEKLLRKTEENDRIIVRAEKEIQYRKEKNERLLRICKKLRPDMDFT